MIIKMRDTAARLFRELPKKRGANVPPMRGTWTLGFSHLPLGSLIYTILSAMRQMLVDVPIWLEK